MATSRKKKKRRSPLPVLLCIALVIGIVAVAMHFFEENSTNKNVMDTAAYYGVTDGTEAPLIVNDQILDERGMIRDGKIYIDYDVVCSYFSGGFYWESATNQMLMTLPSGTSVWTPDDGSGNLIREGDTLYLSADCVKENSDIDLEILENPSRVVARTTWKNVTAETVTVDTQIRARSDKKSEIIKYVSAGDTVVLVENSDRWCKVSTSDGLIGYIQKKELETAPEGTISHTTDSKFVFDHMLVDNMVSMGWQYVGEGSDQIADLAGVTNTAQGLNVISPTWFSFADTAGNLVSYANADYVTEAHNRGIAVWPALMDVYGGEVTAPGILATYEARSNVINQLMSIAAETGIDGINVDIETIDEDSVPQYLQFLKELVVAGHAQNLIISVDNYVPLYTSYLNRRTQARIVDYLVIMAYDEHTAGSEEAGSVSSLPFVEQGITDTLAEAPAKQVICGIPFYTRGWTATFGVELPASEALGMDAAAQWAEAHDITLNWDSENGQNYGTSEDGSARYSIWMEDEKSIGEKMKLIEKYDLAGVSVWRLGLERADVWSIIQEYLN